MQTITSPNLTSDTVRPSSRQISADDRRASVDELNSASYKIRHTDALRSQELAMEAKRLAEKSSYPNGIANATLNIGFQQLFRSEYDNSFSSFNRALTIFQEENDRAGIAHALFDLGVLYLRLGDYDHAMDTQQESLKIRTELHDLDGIASCNVQIGFVHSQFGLDSKALEVYRESLQIWKAIGNKAGLAGVLMAIGMVKIKLKDIAGAKSDLKESLYIRREINEPTGIFGSSNYLAEVYLSEGDTRSAFDLLQGVIKQAVNSPQPFAAGICRLRTTLAKVYEKLGDNASAIRELKEAAQLAEETKQLYQLHFMYIELTKIYKSIGSFDQALHYHEKFHEAKQNVLNLNAASKLKNLEMMNKVELSAKEVEIQRLRNVELIKRNKLIRDERRRSEELLINILPRQTARELKRSGTTKTRHYDSVTVLFTDFVNFTNTAELLSPRDLVIRLHKYFSFFDQVMADHNVEKIKTIGDAYMAAGGVPVAGNRHAEDVVRAALQIVRYVNEQNDPLFRMRVGVHTGPVVAGVVGTRKFAFDIWGDTVNIAARMESSGQAGQVNISGTTYELIKHDFNCLYRGKIEAKRKGMIDMYFVNPQ